MAKKQKQESEVEVLSVQRGEIKTIIRGTQPLVLNRLSQKAQRELLLPKGKKTAAEKKSQLKHNPIREFRDAPHQLSKGHPTLLAIPATAVKKSMMVAALDMEGVTKAAIGRQVYVPGEYIAVYGTPKMYIRAVRSADMNRTPDIRTRCIVPEWCCELTIQFAKPILRDKPVINLLAAGGIMSGIGDFRPEKGAGTMGQFELVGTDDKIAKRLMKNEGRKVQIDAMAAAEPYDDESRELSEWFNEEAASRGWKFDATGNIVEAA